MIPSFAVCIFKDGDQWCAVWGDFINLQESIVGFGDSSVSAIDSLLENSREKGS
jgi:hypothetical protein